MPKELTGLKKKGPGAGGRGKGDSHGKKGSYYSSDIKCWSTNGKHMAAAYVLLDAKE